MYIQSDEKDRLGETLRQAGKAREDQWAAQRDRDLLAAMRREQSRQGRAWDCAARVAAPVFENPVPDRLHRELAGGDEAGGEPGDPPRRDALPAACVPAAFICPPPLGEGRYLKIAGIFWEQATSQNHDGSDSNLNFSSGSRPVLNAAEADELPIKKMEQLQGADWSAPYHKPLLDRKKIILQRMGAICDNPPE